jgi:hypothetical protein
VSSRPGDCRREEVDRETDRENYQGSKGFHLETPFMV